jgi:hypothetical protein
MPLFFWQKMLMEDNRNLHSYKIILNYCQLLPGTLLLHSTFTQLRKLFYPSLQNT